MSVALYTNPSLIAILGQIDLVHTTPSLSFVLILYVNLHFSLPLCFVCFFYKYPTYVRSSSLHFIIIIIFIIDRLCGLVVRVLGYRSGGPSSIPGTTRKKKGTGSTQPREYN
jgi:hypothetical protein